jgi:hypothetical protein
VEFYFEGSTRGIKIVFNNFKNMKTPFNKFLYIGFIIIGLYQTIFTKDYMQDAASMGIGLAFDPFDTEQKWNERPTWQKAVLIVHLAAVAALFGYGVGLNDK